MTTLNAITRDLITANSRETFQATEKMESAKASRQPVADALWAQGSRAADLVAKTGNSELIAEVKSAIVAGFNKEPRELVEATREEAAQWSEEKKAKRKYWQQQVGSILGAYKRMLHKMEYPDGEPGEKADPKKPSKPDDVLTVDVEKLPQELKLPALRKLANAIEAIAQEDEDPSYNVTQLMLFVAGVKDTLAGVKPKAIPASKLK